MPGGLGPEKARGLGQTDPSRVREELGVGLLWHPRHCSLAEMPDLRRWLRLLVVAGVGLVVQVVRVY